MDPSTQNVLEKLRISILLNKIKVLIIHVEYIEIKYAIIEISILLFTKSFKKNKIIDDKNGIKANLKIVYRLIFLNPLKITHAL